MNTHNQKYTQVVNKTDAPLSGVQVVLSGAPDIVKAWNCTEAGAVDGEGPAFAYGLPGEGCNGFVWGGGAAAAGAPQTLSRPGTALRRALLTGRAPPLPMACRVRAACGVSRLLCER